MSDARLRQSRAYGRGTWFVNGARLVRLQLRETIRANFVSTSSGKDISDAAWEVYLRAFVPSDPTTLVLDEPMTKLVTVSEEGDRGEVSVIATIRAAYPELRMCVAIADTNEDDDTTPSGSREYSTLLWAADCAVAAHGAAA